MAREGDMEKEELLERYEAYGHESDYAEARRLYEQALADGAADARTLNGFGYLQECHGRRGRPDDALADWQRAYSLDPDNLSSRYSSAFLLERQGRLAGAAGEWRFIIGWCEERGYDMTTDWPKQELQRLETQLAGRVGSAKQAPYRRPGPARG